MIVRMFEYGLLVCSKKVDDANHTRSGGDESLIDWKQPDFKFEHPKCKTALRDVRQEGRAVKS